MTRRRDRGFTLLEVLVSMAVLLIGSLGLLSLHTYGTRMTADGRSVTRATAIAQDLITQMQTWDYANDPRLVNSVASNDATYAESDAYDHSEDELESAPLPATWLGLSSDEVKALGYTRHWNVAEPEGVAVGRRVAVAVQWERGGVVRRVVIVTFLKNPQVTN